MLEIAVHGLVDLAAALGWEPWTTPGAAAVVRGILMRLLGLEPPVGLGWDDVTFTEKGTGRRPLSDGVRAILGPAAGRFPLLG